MEDNGIIQNYTDRSNDYIHKFYDSVVQGVPRFLGAFVILLIGYVIAKVVASIVRKLLRSVRLNKRLHSGQGGNILQRAIPNPTSLLASIVFWSIFLLSLSAAVGTLGLPVLTDITKGIFSYLPNVIASLAIFMIASAVAVGIANVIKNIMGDTPTGRILIAAGPMVIMSLAIFMILNQLKIAPQIVTITYAGLIGSAALGMALAFGLGGRDIARELLEDVHQKTKAQSATIVGDIRQAGSKIKEQAR